ncbi:SapB/AmfS family lanthipeptide [Streptomyces sp. CB02923]
MALLDLQLLPVRKTVRADGGLHSGSCASLLLCDSCGSLLLC